MRRAFIFTIACVFSIFFSTIETKADLHKRKNTTGLIYWHGDLNKKKIALTFDDGPNVPYTFGILKILEEHNIKATFFLIGKYVEEYPHIARRILQQGHVIGNHTYSHPDLRFMFNDSIRREIERGEDIIVEATGSKPFLFRPPYGARSRRIVDIAKEMGYVTIEYSVSGSDGGKKIKPEKIVKNILRKVRAGSIILIHDGDRFVKNANRKQSLEALPKVITYLRQKGYELVTIPQLLGLESEK